MHVSFICGLPAACPVPRWSKEVSTRLPVSSLLYPSRTKLLMENWTPLQFPALCWLNNPFHLLFIPLRSAHTSCQPIMPRCWVPELRVYGGYRGLSEESFRALCRSSVAQQISQNTELVLNCLMEVSHARGNRWGAASPKHDAWFIMQWYNSLSWHGVIVTAISVSFWEKLSTVTRKTETSSDILMPGSNINTIHPVAKCWICFTH